VGVIAVVAALVATTGTVSASNAVKHNHWTKEKPLPVTRGEFAMTAGPDGRLYLLGGSDGVQAWQTTLIYTPSTNSWSMGAGIPSCSCFEDAAATGPSGKILEVGLGSAEQYNTSTNTWKVVASPPDGAYYSAAATTDGLIYVMGGNLPGVSNIVQVYNPYTNTWSIGPSMHTARDFFVAVTAPNGDIYAIGGYNNTGAIGSVEAFNPTTGTWSYEASLPVACSTRNGAVGPDGRIYIMGCAAGSTSTVYAYSPTSNTWTTVASTPTVDSAYGGAATAGSKLYSVSGYTKLLFGYTP
jgi:N-acetylneuraminic acid mutarotase